MNNPYEVLGVSPSASDEEIRNAYKELAKKYHPDNYNDSVLSDVAEEKMKEINEAYDTICEQRKNGYHSSSQNASYYNSNTSTSYPDVRKLIADGRLEDAEQLLNGVMINMRNAEWYFLMGMVFSRKGWNDQAYSYFQRAVQMDPSNNEYRAAFNNINNRRTYNNPGYNPNNPGCSVCDICTGMMLADCCCSCMSGGRGCCC